MSTLNVEESVMSAIEKAEKAYHKRVKSDVIERAKTVCDICEVLEDEFEAIDPIVMVSNMLECLTISVDAAEMTFHFGVTHPFFTGVNACDRISFAPTHDDGVRVTFRFDNIWEGK